MDPFIEARNVTLDIPVYDAHKSFRTTLMQKCVGGIITNASTDLNNKHASKHVAVRALDNISFRIEKGDRLAIVGSNGAGKTSLLQVLAGVYKPMHGTIIHRGKITPLLNISLGLDMDDTGLENIQTISTYLGMTQQEIAERKQEIIDFTELNDFINLPVRTYSSGMLARLTFGIATTLDPEILLMDEGIGAGDASFAQKAKARLDSFYQKSNIMIMASHSEQLLRDLCNKAILLGKGKVIAFGSLDDIFMRYQESVEKNLATSVITR